MTPIMRSAPIIIRAFMLSVAIPSGLSLSCAAPGEFLPIPLIAASFNHDIIVERTAPPPLQPATTASVEAGFANAGYSWFEKGYQAEWPATGLPTAGTTISSELAMDQEYQFAPDYRSNNAVVIDSVVTQAEVTFVSPALCVGLSFLLSGGHDGSSALVGCAVRHQDSTLQRDSIRCLDWLDSRPIYACTSHGRVDVTNFTFADLNANRPKLFPAELTVSNRTSPVIAVELSYLGGAGHSVVMAISGATVEGGPIGPMAFTGYNADVVVEATAVRAEALRGVTTATMTGGAMNNHWTWYERGYLPGTPQSGLPTAGSRLTNGWAADQVFQLPGSYTANNAALVDAESPTVNLVPALPIACGRLALLTAAAGGPAANAWVVQHADGSAQTNTLVSPDWLDTSLPPAVAAAGRVNINNRLLADVGGAGPRLYALELPLTNTLSPVTNIQVRAGSGPPGAHTAVLGVSGATCGSSAGRPVLSIELQPGGGLLLRSSEPGQVEYTTALDGAGMGWHDAGPIVDTLAIAPAPGDPARFYRVVGY